MEHKYIIPHFKCFVYIIFKNFLDLFFKIIFTVVSKYDIIKVQKQNNGGIYMDIKINSKSMKITEGMKQATIERLNVLNKFLNESDVIKISVKVVKKEINVCTMIMYEDTLVKITQTGDDYYTIISDVADRMKEKFEKLHTKKVKKQKDQAKVLNAMEYDFEVEEKEFMNQEIITKVKTVKLEPVTPEEAINKMEELGHESYIFLNKLTNTHCMIYTRNDGGYGLIETE